MSENFIAFEDCDFLSEKAHTDMARLSAQFRASVDAQGLKFRLVCFDQINVLPRSPWNDMVMVNFAFGT